MSVTTTSSTAMSTGESISAWRTIARGVDFSPELKEGIWLTGFFAVLATLGRVVVPIAVQQTLDRGLNGPGGPDTAFMTRMAVARKPMPQPIKTARGVIWPVST